MLFKIAEKIVPSSPPAYSLGAVDRRFENSEDLFWLVAKTMFGL